MAKKEEDNKIEISRNMVINCKADISKFGFNPGDYEKFLVYVKAMKETGEVLQYRNKQLPEYRDAYLKKNEQDMGDAFILDKFKILTSKDDGVRSIQYETGWFAPRSFWDYILDYRLES
jgi:hypothetical protein